MSQLDFKKNPTTFLCRAGDLERLLIHLEKGTAVDFSTSRFICANSICVSSDSRQTLTVFYVWSELKQCFLSFALFLVNRYTNVAGKISFLFILAENAGKVMDQSVGSTVNT